MADIRQKANILIVDDKPEKVLSLEAVVEDLDETIVRAHSGREALRCLLNEEFAVILLDVNMPGMDGFETASLIRQRKSTEDVPIIFVTAMPDEMDMARGYSLGAVDYILTPIVPDVLRTKVAVFVDLYRKRAEVKRQAESLRRKAAQLHKLTEASIAINSAISIRKMTRILADTGMDILGVHQVYVTVVSDGNWSRAQTAAALSDKYSAYRGAPSPAVNGELRAQVCRGGKAVRLSRHDAETHFAGVETSRPPLAGWLAVPLAGRDGRNLGLMEASDKDEGEFHDDDEAMFVQLGQIASIAIENALFAEEREANRIKDEFLATLSHELRTPLNAMLGWTQILRARELPEEVAHGLAVIDRNVRAQARLIEDLLDISRITTGKFLLNVRPMDVSSVVAAAVEAIRPAASAKRIHIKCSGSEVDQPIAGDPDRLQQVIWNLLSNAVKFTPDQGTVDVSLMRSESAVRIIVKDTGLGMQPGFLPHVFDRFRQADSSSTRSHGGLGIGLSIARHIVELHGGQIRAQSPGSGQGSTFIVELPLAALQAGNGMPAPASVAATEAAAGAGGAAVELSGCRVLLVDDEADARELVARILTRYGAEVTAVSSAREALGALGGSHAHVLVSDIALPGEDGYDLIAAVRELSRQEGGEIPALALTAYARADDRERALASGFQRHLAKPVEPRDLASAVWELAESYRPVAAGQSSLLL